MQHKKILLRGARPLWSGPRLDQHDVASKGPMDLIHNDDLWHHKIKMAAIVGGIHKIYMDDYGKKIF